MKLLFDFLPIFIFFIAYKLYGIYAATSIAIVISFLQVTISRIRNKRFETMPIIAFFSILVLGSTTLLMHNEIFIKWKPTILYWILSLLFIGSLVLGKKPLIQKLMEGSIQLPSLIWRRLNVIWSAFFLFLGSVNLFVVYHYTTNAWVNFKLFGTLGLTLIFVIAQSIYMSKYIGR